jgi:hypothetical protein
MASAHATQVQSVANQVVVVAMRLGVAWLRGAAEAAELPDVLLRRRIAQ